MEVNKMTFTKYLLIMLANSDYSYIERAGIDLYALKWYPDSQNDNLNVYDFCLKFSYTDLFIDTTFFEKYVEDNSIQETEDLLKEYEDYCREYQKGQENTDSDFVKFLKDETNSIIDLFKRKNESYGSKIDVFHNFRSTAKRIFGDDTFNNMFLVAETYKDKHNVALSKGVMIPEVEERLRDNIVYSILQLAMIKEMEKESENKTTE